MNNLLSYCGLVVKKVRASDKDLLVFKELHKIDHKTGKPNKIQLFYTLVRDFSDVRTQELVLDQAWYVLLITLFSRILNFLFVIVFFLRKNCLFKAVILASMYFHS